MIYGLHVSIRRIIRLHKLKLLIIIHKISFGNVLIPVYWRLKMYQLEHKHCLLVFDDRVKREDDLGDIHTA